MHIIDSVPLRTNNGENLIDISSYPLEDSIIREPAAQVTDILFEQIRHSYWNNPRALLVNNIDKAFPVRSPVDFIGIWEECINADLDFNICRKIVEKLYKTDADGLSLFLGIFANPRKVAYDVIRHYKNLHDKAEKFEKGSGFLNDLNFWLSLNARFRVRHNFNKAALIRFNYPSIDTNLYTTSMVRGKLLIQPLMFSLQQIRENLEKQKSETGKPFSKNERLVLFGTESHLYIRVPMVGVLALHECRRRKCGVGGLFGVVADLREEMADTRRAMVRIEAAYWIEDDLEKAIKLRKN